MNTLKGLIEMRWNFRLNEWVYSFWEHFTTISYPKKFIIISAIFLSALFIADTLLFIEKIKDIETISNEISGVEYEKKVLNLLNKIIQHKILFLYEAEQNQPSDELKSLQHTVKEALDELIKIDRENSVWEQRSDFTQIEKINFKPEELLKTWNLISSNDSMSTPTQIEELHSDLIYQLISIINYVLIASELNLESDVFNTLLINITFTYLPREQDLISQAIILGDYNLKKLSSTTVETGQLISLNSLISSNLDNMQASIRSTLIRMRGSEEEKLYKQDIESTLANYSAEAYDFTNLIAVKIINVPSLAYPRSDFNTQGLNTLALGKSGSDQVLIILDQQLRAKRWYLIRQISLSIGISILIAALGFFIGLRVMQRISRPLLELFQANQQLAAGHWSTRVPIVSSDEVGQVGKAFNSMASMIEEYGRDLEKKVAQRTEELAQSLQKLKQMQKQLIVQEKLSSLGALTAGIAHEIKNPLNFINNFSESAMELTAKIVAMWETHKEAYDEKQIKDFNKKFTRLGDLVRKIHEHGKRADGIVIGMLSHARGTRGDMRTIKIVNLVEEAINLAYHGVRAKDTNFNVTFEKKFDANVELVDVVSGDFSRVLLNLINNSCYSVNVKKKQLGNTYDPIITVSILDRGENFAISVRDNGLGLSKEALEKLFTPFYTTKPPGEGTGLGLSISRDIIVSMHNGEILVDSQEGQWAEFTVLVPKKMVKKT